ncbi:alpha/beta-hydrolase [Coccomyxa subellipsoidea C-169]|uniref:Alpha/beta-hydrolase n=1 Tax=Coccomyxa subellipsoidea (strain C-169) TaxID=574566 RepID=I0YKC6_COCSC|nr:alpha/beta-hydrolase [Coccomyxa subellipsoidea C-169]EIE18845.1 alpha/beta-hydrolase [Coccomyxa subellipsoidea C-169]|eukprot:XP_005643389.1 alpha/beta-hydrolase [Coccomyxa subellipsoidea C-169]
MADFNLPLAVALGACSFEAYNLPYHMYGIKELHPCGAETLYMDPAYLEEIVEGLLRVHVRHAFGLQPQGEKQECNPFVTVALGPGAGRTHAVKGSSDPIWRETLFLYVRDSETQSLTVHVEHAAREPENINVLLGYAEMKDLKKLCDGDVHNLQLDLQGEGCSGSVDFSVRYEPCEYKAEAIDSIKAKAVGQMLIDDWAPGREDWFDAESDTWHYEPGEGERFPGLEEAALGDHVQQVLSDATGNLLTEGVDPTREEWKAWTSFRDSIAEEWNPDSLKAVAFILNRATSTEVWIYRNQQTREAVIAFRGTSNPQDMMTDAALAMSAFSPGHRSGGSKSPNDVAAELSDEEVLQGPLGGIFASIKSMERVRLPKLPFGKKKKKGSRKTRPLKAVQGLKAWAKAQSVMLYGVEHDEIWVHEGFNEAYQSVKPRVLDIFDEIIGECVNSRSPAAGKSNDDRWRVYLTGHSMGGALATLCAYELAARDYGNVPEPAVTMYSFGQPRVGNLPFSSDYDEVVPDSWRVKNANDIVTRVPSLLGYHHIGVEVQMFPDGQLTISRETSDDLREGAFAADIIPKINEGMLGDDPKAKEEFEALAKADMEVWKSIMSGAAIMEHMEDKYHDMLKKCVEKRDEGGKLPVKNLAETGE